MLFGTGLERSGSLRFAAAPGLVGEEGHAYRLARRTAWVGNIPLALARRQDDLRSLLSQFGEVEKMTVRVKTAEAGTHYGSWCLACYKGPEAVDAALAAKLEVDADPEAGAGEASTGVVVLEVRQSDVKGELQKQAAGESSPGLLRRQSTRVHEPKWLADSAPPDAKKRWKKARSAYLVTKALRSGNGSATLGQPAGPHAGSGIFRSVQGAQDRSAHATTMMMSEVIDRLVSASVFATFCSCTNSVSMLGLTCLAACAAHDGGGDGGHEARDGGARGRGPLPDPPDPRGARPDLDAARGGRRGGRARAVGIAPTPREHRRADGCGGRPRGALVRRGVALGLASFRAGGLVALAACKRMYGVAPWPTNIVARNAARAAGNHEV